MGQHGLLLLYCMDSVQNYGSLKKCTVQTPKAVLSHILHIFQSNLLVKTQEYLRNWLSCLRKKQKGLRDRFKHLILSFGGWVCHVRNTSLKVLREVGIIVTVLPDIPVTAC